MNRPYIRTRATVTTIGIDLLIALVPAVAWAVFSRGAGAAGIIAASLAGACAADAVFDLCRKKLPGFELLCAPLIGIVTGLCLPHDAPVWLAASAGLAAELIFGRLADLTGRRFINPTAAAICLVLLIFGGMLSKDQNAVIAGLGPKHLDFGVQTLITPNNAALGTAPAAVLIGLAYLLIRRVISIHIPLAFMLTFGVLTMLFTSNPTDADAPVFALSQMLSGTVLLGAVLVAPMYASSPASAGGRLLFGIGCGALTFLFRHMGATGALSEGTMFAIVCMNIFVPLIERVAYRRKK